MKPTFNKKEGTTTTIVKDYVATSFASEPKSCKRSTLNERRGLNSALKVVLKNSFELERSITEFHADIGQQIDELISSENAFDRSVI